jgi:hypothetical protein
VNQFESNAMSARLVPTLQEILYRLVGVATKESLSTPTSTNPGRFPVVVRPETRAFLEAQANYLGGSIAGVAGAILDGVAMSTQGRDGGATALQGITERFNLLVQEHDLSFPAAVEALADIGFTLADFASTENLLLKLTSPVLRQIAERFHIRYDWLAGKGDIVTQAAPHSWYKSVGQAANKLVQAHNDWSHAELMLFVKQGTDLERTNDDADWDLLPHFIPVLKRSRMLRGGEELATYEVWEEGRWSYWRCREHIKLVIYFALRTRVLITGKTLPNTDYDGLLNGRALPVTILRRNSNLVSWHPDDYVMPDSRVAKAPDEWRTIVNNKDNAQVFKYFDELLQCGGAER